MMKEQYVYNNKLHKNAYSYNRHELNPLAFPYSKEHKRQKEKRDFVIHMGFKDLQ